MVFTCKIPQLLLKRSLSSFKYKDVTELADRIRIGDHRAISKSITLLESQLSEHQSMSDDLIKNLQERGNSRKPKNIRIAISGAPGVGKSTLIEKLGLYLTVDPSSILTGGSLLGDKTRMPNLSQHENAFIRSSPNRGDMGGIISSTFDTIRLCEYAGYDVILVETVGVGQSELAVVDLVDFFVLIVAPGVGDELQGMKKGITEIADIILVNKADDPYDQAANKTLLEYKSAFKYSFHADHQKSVLPVSGKTGRGISEAWSTIQDKFKTLQKEVEGRRLSQIQKWTVALAEQQLVKRFREYISGNQCDFGITDNVTLKTLAQRITSKYLGH